MCSAFHDSSHYLWSAVAAVGRQLCTTFVDPVGLQALTSCRLIALDKHPGVRPIGIGEVARRIIDKAILSIVKDDVLKVAGMQQLCGGQQSECEAAIHAVRSIFESPSCQAILQVDETNAFNNLNRTTALINILRSCPSIAPALIKTYRHKSSLYIGGEIIPYCEGTTQGDPLKMAMFALTILPLINKLSQELKQCWYADNASAGGELQHIKAWWDGLAQLSPEYGYFPKPEKTWLVVKEEHYDSASATFAGSGIQLTRHGKHYLGSAIGSAEFIEAFVKMKIEGWINEIEQLSLIAKTHPHAVYAAYTLGLSHTWKFLLRTTLGTCNIPNIRDLLTPLETAIRYSLIPKITGKIDLDNHMRRVMALPTYLHGLGLEDPRSESESEYSASQNQSHPISEFNLQQYGQLNADTLEKQRQARSAVRQEKRHAAAEDTRLLLDELLDDIKRMVNLAAEKGASNWLSVLPVAEHSFYFNKTAFKDAICLRFGWRPERLPE